MKEARRNSLRRERIASFALIASKNAKRSSIALDIPFEVIRNGIIYQFKEGKMVQKASIERMTADKGRITKGSKICLK
ncbi:hypothetical protein VUJ46_10860 [Chryseobacterium sp. MYb264]|uniref:hypothetical protein n=1 Tax=Chryseobacterium sp. MYb264 TaxID=2745153 RepID=UPI002E10B634|nr:hypothetical protein VUJ46_10860 [Chryseobacterium sp. MYb264]